MLLFLVLFCQKLKHLSLGSKTFLKAVTHWEDQVGRLSLPVSQDWQLTHHGDQWRVIASEHRDS